MCSCVHSCRWKVLIAFVVHSDLINNISQEKLNEELVLFMYYGYVSVEVFIVPISSFS